MAKKTKSYEVEYEQIVTIKAKVVATSQREALRLAKEEREDYDWLEANRTAAFSFRIAGTKGSSAQRVFDRYKTYEGERGSPEQWKASFEKAYAVTALSLLGLTELPATIGDLRMVRRRIVAKIHPDLGGTEEQTARVNKAFEDLKKQIENQKDIKIKIKPMQKSAATKKEAKNMDTIQIEKLAKKLKAASALYYDDQATGISDEDFDALRDELEALAPNHPFLRQVGSPPTSGVWPKVEPMMPMGSQKKIKTEEELMNWFYSYTNGSDLFWSDKLDGGSIEKIYENGVLVRGATRGGGNLGEDITPNVKGMGGIPKEISYKGRIAIRSEVMLLTAVWLEHFPDKKEARSAASGHARAKTPDKLEHLTLFSFDALALDDPDFFKTKAEIFEFLIKEGFTVPNHGMIGRDIDKMQKIKDSYEESLRANLPYEIDGLVVEVNDLAVAKELGVSDGRPRGARAYKFSSLATTTELIDVVWQVGRTCIAPVGIIKPVTLGGSTINRVTLCNIDKIEVWGLGIGSQIKVCRSNDVIPKLLEALTPGEKIVPPEFCPSCEAPTRTDGVRLYCTGDLCNASTAKTIRHYLVALDVKGLGKSQITKFVESSRIETPADLYSLSAGEFDSEKIGTKVLEDLRSKSQNVNVFDFVKGLGIHLFGRGNTKKVLKVIPTFEGIRKATANEIKSAMSESPSDKDDWQQDEGKVALSAVRGLKAKKDLIDALLKHVTLRDHTINKNSNGGCDLVGKSFVFTGYRNKEAEAIIESRGGRIATSVAANLSYIVTKDPNSSSSKMNKARSLGVIILDAQGLEALLG